MKLQGQRSFLRAVEPHDVNHFFKWENDTDNWLVSGTTSPFSRNDLEKYIRGIRDVYADRQLRLVICTEERPVGAIDLFDFDPTHLRAGVGILIGEKEEREQGVAYDALTTLIEYGFDVLHLHQIYANIPANNHASVALFEKAGFELTATRKQWLKGSDGYIDELFYQLIKK
ncbi:GNAT family N-acetyltransferase [Sanyastnella coralliicola]|uniref:GNAT family N-acetyltransferase n=1 Tax=Sanyastnella coralliicola TaxID=3069118 RepID=UPI0027BB1A8C|nr:GNAT family protein [Longitalea sp. SCSIO 12813]